MTIGRHFHSKGMPYRISYCFAKAREIRATHYVHGDSDSPNHSLAQSDYKSQADDESEMMSIADASDAYHTLQMIEDPNHPILYNRELYRCHCESQASNNVLILLLLRSEQPLHRFQGQRQN